MASSKVCTKWNCTYSREMMCRMHALDALIAGHPAHADGSQGTEMPASSPPGMAGAAGAAPPSKSPSSSSEKSTGLLGGPAIPDSVGGMGMPRRWPICQ